MNLEQLKEQLAQEKKRRQDTAQPVDGPTQEPAIETNTAPRLTGFFGEGTSEGIANILGAPVDLVSAGLGSLGVNVGDQPVGGSQSIKALMGTAGVLSGAEPQTASERIVKRAGEEVGATAIPVLGIQARSAQLAAKGADASTMLGRAFTSQNVARISASPSAKTVFKTIAAEEGIGLTAGLGAGVAREVIDSPTADFVGSLAGSFLPTAITGTGKRLLSAGKLTIFGPDASDVSQAATKVAAEEVQRAAGDVDAALSNINRAMNQASNIPGTTVPPASAAGQKGLIDLERRVASKSPALVARLQQAEQSNADNFSRLLMDVTPEGQPAAVGQAFRQRANDLQRAVDDSLAIAQNKANLRIAQLAPDPDSRTPEILNSILREEIEAAARQSHTRVSNLFNSIPENIEIPTLPLKAAMANVRKGIKQTTAADSIPTDIMNLIKGMKGKNSFGELRVLRTRIRREIEREQAQIPPNREKVMRLTQLLDGAVSTLDQMGTQGVATPAIAERYNLANSAARQHAETYRKGTVGVVLRRGIEGAQSRLPESATIGEFFAKDTRKGAAERMQDLIRSVGDREEAVAAVHDYAIMDALRFAGGKLGGKVDPQRLQQWILNHRAALDSMPELRKQLGSVASLQKRVQDLSKRVTRTSDAVQRNAAQVFLDSTPQEAMQSVLSSRKAVTKMNNILHSVKGNKEAIAGLKRGFWDELARRSGLSDDANPLHIFDNPSRMMDALQQNRIVAKQLFGKDLDNIEKVLGAAAAAQRRAAVPAVRGGVTPIEGGIFAKTGLSLNQVLSRAYAVTRGVVSGRFVASELAARTINRVMGKMTAEQAQALLEDALSDPEVMKTLLTTPTKANAAQIERNLRLHLLNTGTVSLRENDES